MDWRSGAWRSRRHTPQVPLDSRGIHCCLPESFLCPFGIAVLQPSMCQAFTDQQPIYPHFRTVRLPTIIVSPSMTRTTSQTPSVMGLCNREESGSLYAGTNVLSRRSGASGRLHPTQESRTTFSVVF